MTYLGLAAAAVFSLGLMTAVDAGAAEGNPEVVLDTTEGPITIELDQAKAPVSVANFLKYVDAKHYDGVIFHRVIPGFMIQGGGMTKDMREKPAQASIKNEASNGLTNQRGTIAMARTGDPNSAKAQFFVNLVDNSRNLGPGGVDAFGYAVFGKVTSGMETVDAIAKVPTGAQDVPTRPIVIKSARRKAKS